MQIIHAITKLQAMPSLEIHVHKDSEDKVLINNILKPNYMHSKLSLEEGNIILGQIFSKTLDDAELKTVSSVTTCISVYVTEYEINFITSLSCSVYG